MCLGEEVGGVRVLIKVRCKRPANVRACVSVCECVCVPPPREFAWLMQNSTRASRALARTGSPSGARRAVKTSSAAFVSLLFCRFSAWASRFITFNVNFSILSPHLSRRLMRNLPCAGASVRAGSVPLCNLNSIQHSPLFPPLPTRFLAANVEKGDLNFRQKHLPEKENKI